MVNNKSTLKISVEIQSESAKEPQTTEIVYPNLDYASVLMIEKALLGALNEMNEFGYAQLEGLKTAKPGK